MDILILNSAQGKYPRGCDPWVRATVEAFTSLSCRECRFVTSADPVTWSLVTYLAAVARVPSLLVIPHADSDSGRSSCAGIFEQYCLDHSLATPVFLPSALNRTKDMWRLRDRMAFECADTVVPVSIRPGGRLDALIGEFSTKMLRMDGHRTVWRREKRHSLPDFSDGVRPLPCGDWLVHWTRSCSGPWPGEHAHDFFKDMLDCPGIYVRSALATLARILREGVIRGSSWRMPGNTAAVSFSALGMSEAMPLMRWRSRYVRYSFEPYGIAIRRSALESLGGHPVVYQRGTKAACGDGFLFTQSHGEYTDWQREREWRVKGDVRLGMIGSGDIMAIVPDSSAKRSVIEDAGRDMKIHRLTAQ